MKTKAPALNLKQGQDLLVPCRIMSSFLRPMQVTVAATASPWFVDVSPASAMAQPGSTNVSLHAITKAMGPPGPVQLGIALSITEYKENIPGGYQAGDSMLIGEMVHNELHLDYAAGTTLVATVGTNDPLVPDVALFPKTTCEFNVTITNTGTPTTVTLAPTGSFPSGVEVVPQQYPIAGAPSEGQLAITTVTVKFKVRAMADVAKDQSLSLVCRSTTIWDNLLTDVIAMKLTTQRACRGFALAPYDLSDKVTTDLANLVLFSDGTWRFLWRIYDHSTFYGDNYVIGWEVTGLPGVGWMKEEEQVGHKDNVQDLIVSDQPFDLLRQNWVTIFSGGAHEVGIASAKSLWQILSEDYKALQNLAQGANKASGGKLGQFLNEEDPTGMTNPALLNGFD